MLSTCPRCGKPRSFVFPGPATPCPSCGYTDLVNSAAPPASSQGAEPLWGPALATCIGVSVVVFLGALVMARIAAATETGAGAPEVCEAAEWSSACRPEPAWSSSRPTPVAVGREPKATR